jgi:DNA-binding NarL/FixJ family response regulator
MGTTHIRVLLVDDNDDLAEALAMIIEDEPDMTCVHRLNSADELMPTLDKHRPDVVLLDLSMPGRDPLDALGEASSAFPDVRIIMLSGYQDPALMDTALERGAWSYVCKSGDIAEILKSVRTVMAAKPPPASRS